MRKSLSILAFVVVGAAMMFGQASRTWVSGVGDDANPCSRTAPCKTFAGAISKTATGGEIDALDPGGFGALTITKSITLDGGGGQVASVLVQGTNGIVVTCTGCNVIIRNLRINGLKDSGNGGLSGILFLAGNDLNVENCYIFGFQTGINISLNQNTAASVHILNSVMKNNSANGVRAANAQAPAVQTSIDHSSAILDNIGIESAQHSHMTVTNSLASKAAADGMKVDDAVSGDAQLTVHNSVSSNNVNGLTAGTAGSFASISESVLSFNSSCGLNNAAGGANMFTFQQGGNGTNKGAGNGANTCGTLTSLPTF
jgi:hypothetical protein